MYLKFDTFSCVSVLEEGHQQCLVRSGKKSMVEASKQDIQTKEMAASSQAEKPAAKDESQVITMLGPIFKDIQKLREV